MVSSSSSPVGENKQVTYLRDYGLRGRLLLEFNKGTAFTHEERAELCLERLLLPALETLDQQHQRVIQQLGG
jgi:hypothetical protein